MGKDSSWETHWFELKDSFLLELKSGLLEELIQKGMKKAGNLSQLSKLLNFSCPTFYNFVNHKKIKMISIGKLKILLNYLEIDYAFLNKKIKLTKKGSVVSIKNPKFPIDLNNKEGAYLLGLIVSDGCIYIDRKARNQIRTKYAAGEKDSEDNFFNTINKLYGEVHILREFERNCAILRIGTSIIGESLLKAGAILGHKAAKDEEVPWLVKEGTEDIKASYLKAVFDDESSVYKEKSRNCGYVILTRYRHLTDLTKKQEEELKKLEKEMSSRTFPTGHVTQYITIKKAAAMIKDKKLLGELKIPPRLLQGEAELLNEFKINNRFFGRYLTKTHLGRYSLCFDLFINQKDSLKKFYKHIGYSLPRKQSKLSILVGRENAANVTQYLN
jgi:hypothetical protein